MPQPPIIDLRGQLPTNGQFPTRSLAAVKIFAVHYDGTDIADTYDPVATYVQEAQYHIDKNWCSDGSVCHGYGIEYHYAVSRKPDPNRPGFTLVYQLENEEALTWNAMNANTLDLAIKVDSGPNTPPTVDQLNTLKELLDWLCTERPEMPAATGDVYGHGELIQYGNSTDCPGVVTLHWVQKYRANEQNDPPVPAPSVNDQVVTLLSVIGAATYKPPVNLGQIQIWVQQAKALLGAH